MHFYDFFQHCYLDFLNKALRFDIYSPKGDSWLVQFHRNDQCIFENDLLSTTHMILSDRIY